MYTPKNIQHFFINTNNPNFLYNLKIILTGWQYFIFLNLMEMPVFKSGSLKLSI